MLYVKMSRIMEACTSEIAQPACSIKGRHVANIVTFIAKGDSQETILVKIGRVLT